MMALVHFLHDFLLDLDCPVLVHVPSDLRHRVHSNSVHVESSGEPAVGWLLAAEAAEEGKRIPVSS